MIFIIQYLKDPVEDPPIVLAKRVSTKRTKEAAWEDAYAGFPIEKAKHGARGFRLLDIQLVPVDLWAEWSEYFL